MSARTALALVLVASGCRPAQTTPVVVPTAAAADLAVVSLDEAYSFSCDFDDEVPESLEWMIEQGDLGYGFLGDADPNPSIEAFRTPDASLVLTRLHHPGAIEALLSWSVGDRARSTARYSEIGVDDAIGRLETLIAIDRERVVGWFCDKAFGVASACRYGVVSAGTDPPTRVAREDLAPLSESIAVELDRDHLVVAGRLVQRAPGSGSGDPLLVLDTIDLASGTVDRAISEVRVPDGYFGVVVSDASTRFVLPEAGTGALRIVDPSGAVGRTLRLAASVACDEREVPRARVRLPFDLEGDLDVGAPAQTDSPADVVSMGVRGESACDLAFEIEHRDGGAGSYEGAVALRLDPVALGRARFVYAAGEAEVVCAED